MHIICSKARLASLASKLLEGTYDCQSWMSLAEAPACKIRPMSTIPIIGIYFAHLWISPTIVKSSKQMGMFIEKLSLHRCLVKMAA